MPRQIEYWVRIDKAVTNNPVISLRLIQDIMLARYEGKAGLAAAFEFG